MAVKRNLVGANAKGRCDRIGAPRPLIEAYRGTVSLPFEAGKHKRVAVKIVDDRGIESLRNIEID